MLRVTDAVLEGTMFPLASWIVTTGWVEKGVLAVELEGLIVKASLLAWP
jgi:hypothetical protein